jgi:hypothetical protein
MRLSGVLAADLGRQTVAELDIKCTGTQWPGRLQGKGNTLVNFQRALPPFAGQFSTRLNSGLFLSVDAHTGALSAEVLRRSPTAALSAPARRLFRARPDLPLP